MSRERVWKLLKVCETVYCSSTGHHFFTAVFDYKGGRRSIDYCLGSGPEKRLPKYAERAIEEKIGFMGPQAFKVHEFDRDGNKRWEELRYHDPEWFADVVRKMYPLPF